MMNEEFVTHFRGDDIPIWPCPKCSSISLKCPEDQFQKQYERPIDTSHPDFDPDWIKYIFTMNLQCTLPSCECRVISTGIGHVSEDYLKDGSGNWAWFDYFQVKYFEPSLRIFSPPENTPCSVKEALEEALETSFSTFFFSPSTSLSNLRSALEVLLSNMEVSSVTENGNYLSLAKRITLLPEDYRIIIEPANAIRWLGNDGAHFGSQVGKSDVLDGYRIFEHILIELFPEKKVSVEDLVTRINAAKGVDRNA